MERLERYCIVGTAPTWRMTPWGDAGLHIASLNDAYQMDGFERADEWYDMHPLDKFHLVADPGHGQKPLIYAHQIPHGHYVRPERHRDWLATQTMPVWLHPDHAAQWPASATWPSARAFPRQALQDEFGRYFTSTPAWMLAHAISRGAREIHIYGIHLATEQEYMEQRPNFEYLIGRVLGRGKLTTTVADGLRRYETADGMVVLPVESPVLDSKFQYAFEVSPRRVLEPLKWELHKAQVKRERRVAALKAANPWIPVMTFEEPDPDGQIVRRRLLTSTVQQELWYYEALVADCQEQLARAQIGV